MDLLPCPFCGGEPEGPFPMSHERRVYIARCGRPDCEVELIADGAEQVADRWNRRLTHPTTAGGDADAVAHLKDPEWWRAKYEDRARVIGAWHTKARGLGYDGVADLLLAVERGEPPLHVAEVLARAAMSARPSERKEQSNG